MNIPYSIFFILLTCLSLHISAQDTPPPPRPEGNLKSRWAFEVSPKSVLPEHPRPQLVRPNWTNLNGKWNYAIRPVGELKPRTFDGQILVPFPAESTLSGVKKWVGKDNNLWYERSFKKPFLGVGERLILHFGAVDWHATIFIDGTMVGEHKGGYDPFSFDITEHVKRGKNHQLTVKVWDPVDSDHQARGKQVSNPRGIWYTSVTGIWQTVWLEVVPDIYIKRLKVTPDIDQEIVHLEVHFSEAPGSCTIITEIETNRPPASISRRNTTLETNVFRAELNVRDFRLWSPKNPFLYDLTVRLKKGEKKLDEVSSYFGMRKISLGTDDRGFTRLFLNNEPYFQFGPLDQGWWPDGLYTAPTDAALKYDLEVLKDMGFNMLRKHVKVEPARFYYHCDQMGMLVWQDMPSGFALGQLRVRADHANDADRPYESAQQFEQELMAMMDYLHNHPSIVVWVPFNEGWGQYDSQRINAMVKAYDPSRLSNPTSGWTDRDVGDIYDTHLYPGPGMEIVSKDRATVLGEFGGLGLPVAGHLWWQKRNWGYRTYKSQDELYSNYKKIMGGLEGLLSMGLSAAIYTQTSDVEGEVNGLMTYDRELVKFDPQMMRTFASNLYSFEGKAQVWLPSSEYRPQLWRYTTEDPGSTWPGGRIDPMSWKSGNGPFGTGDNIALPKGTIWNEGDIWIHQSFQLDQLPSDLRAMVYHGVGTKAEIFLNGRLLATLENGRRSRHYTHLDLSTHANLLANGQNVIEVKLSSEEGKKPSFDIGLYSIE
ncbi:MAG: sugar-binding domain-containing protein [Bacteroidota bacterium]